jgi:hypothetical protein
MCQASARAIAINRDYDENMENVLAAGSSKDQEKNPRRGGECCTRKSANQIASF